MSTTHPLLRRALMGVAVLGITIGAAACDPAPTPAPAPVRASSSSEVDQAIALINDYRAANGLAGLSWAGDAGAKAQQHANEMAASGSVYHSSSLSSGIQSGWRTLGENVGVGGSVSQLQSMFESSSAHRANLLNGAFNQVGVGVAHGGDGRVYVTQFFVGR